MNTKRPKNPERKKVIQGEGQIDYNSPHFIDAWAEYIRENPIEHIEGVTLQEIKKNYESLRQTLPPRAETYLRQAIIEYITVLQRPKTKGLEKVYEIGGIQVFIDSDNISGDYSPTSYNMRMIKFGVNQMLNYIRDILPNRKSNIIITDLKMNKHTRDQMAVVPNSKAMQTNKTIFLDWSSIDEPKYYIHEYAHQLADLIPKQSEELLINAYKELLNMYFRASKRKKLDSSEITDKMREQMARRLNFPVYGLTNHHELFAVIIEYWKKFPNNALTYKFKTLVKNVLGRV